MEIVKEGVQRLGKGRLKWTEACDKAREIVSRGHEMDHLYRRALQHYGEGELRAGILSLALEAIEDQNLKDEVFVNDEGMLSFFCGLWLQFLLTEIGGVKKEDLRSMALTAFKDISGPRVLH
jgi:hypothetical protein